MKFTDVILHTAIKIILFIILAFSVYLLFSGHHHPGGGFVGGLTTSAALVLLSIAFDSRTVREIVPVDFKLVGAVGILLAVLTGSAALVFGAPFLSHVHAEVDVPLIGHMELASALLFDIGVYFAVIGTTMTIIQTISEDE
jgi:monovalent cation:proton antiporter